MIPKMKWILLLAAIIYAGAGLAGSPMLGNTDQNRGTPPAQSDPLSWQRLKENPGFSSLEVNRVDNETCQVGMTLVRIALERAKISEPVAIELKIGQNNPLTLGQFRPRIRKHVRPRTDTRKEADPGLNTVVLFDTIQPHIRLKWSSSSPQPIPLAAELIFKNSTGEVKAQIPVQVCLK